VSHRRIERTLRLCGFLALAAIAVATGSAEAPPAASSGPDPYVAACPGVAAFARQEKERLAGMLAEPEPRPTQPALRDELKAMVDRDQQARNDFSNPDASKQATVVATDAANLVRLKSIVAQLGFPTRKMVGRDGVGNAWLLTQHADTDLAFQKQVLTLLETRAGGDVRPGDLAMLGDRIRVHEGKPQLYGSNFDLKTMQPTPIEDSEHVDERRARVHLMPLADYRCVIEQMYRGMR
jgi:hypothetical protein